MSGAGQAAIGDDVSSASGAVPVGEHPCLLGSHLSSDRSSYRSRYITRRRLRCGPFEHVARGRPGPLREIVNVERTLLDQRLVETKFVVFLFRPGRWSTFVGGMLITQDVIGFSRID
jgi:hypothetical protein